MCLFTVSVAKNPNTALMCNGGDAFCNIFYFFYSLFSFLRNSFLTSGFVDLIVLRIVFCVFCFLSFMKNYVLILQFNIYQDIQ